MNKRASAQCVIQCSVGCGGWGWVRSLSLGSLATAAAGEFSLPAALESRGVDDATLSVFAGLLPKNHEFTSSGGGNFTQSETAKRSMPMPMCAEHAAT